MRMFMRIAVAVGAISLWAVAQGPAGGTLAIPLKGITKDNAPKAEAALAKLDRNGFRCTTCEYFAKEAGNCPGCGTALVAEKAGMLLNNVKIDAVKNLAIFGVAGPHGVRLTEIETILTPMGIEVDKAKLTIAPFTRLTLTGIESEDAGKMLEKALKDAKLYDSVKTDVSVEHKMAILIVGGAKTPPTLETITTTIEKAGPFKISEISWTAACPKCAEKGMKHAGCMSCWEKGA